ncbi:MAG: GFA family protein [Sulfuricaulis sp.]
MSQELSGACACGAVRYAITGPVKSVVNCHCQACRQRGGAAYSTYCVVPQDALKIIQGAENLSTYETTTPARKHFCARCGSPIYNFNGRYPGVYLVYYGSLSENANLVPAANIYCESKLPWVESISSIKSFANAIQR